MNCDLKRRITFISFNMLFVIILIFTSGCITEPDVPQLCIETGCHPIITPKESLQYFELNADVTHNDKKMAQVFSKNVTANYSSFSEDLKVARKTHAPINHRATGYGASLIFINDTFALFNVSLQYPIGEEISRNVPFVYEEERWRIDMSPKYL